MKLRSITVLLLLPLMDCSFLRPTGREARTPRQLYDECMTTFSDDSKCKEFVLKSIPDADVSVLGVAPPQLSAEEKAKLRIRSELIHSLLYQNQLYVKNQIGDPDEKMTINNWAPGMEEWVYTRPICKYAEGSRPDKEIRIRFQRGAVVKVLHTPPDPIR
ncbi:hypothetical protein LEP1GSC047_2502 [Leptospira inadai serovar Lyme str. 10]|uniref:Uncharacterized protein n=2 Tax=Leptospira inadai serovar Lyme TaxID=293084 RepID=V6HD19_9LEPT|nr:hypothetical protein [Leptospira inadai]EQA36873.1 hypothetical protein LEP1GSC047_2502 [Leptospira inadai serovar Lyme str. 10]PNV75682.1 hypothetical protein BES34_006455 [Leptospira inadai serovar Lyme]